MSRRLSPLAHHWSCRHLSSIGASVQAAAFHHANTSHPPVPLPLFTSTPPIHQRLLTCHRLSSHSSRASPPTGCRIASCHLFCQSHQQLPPPLVANALAPASTSCCHCISLRPSLDFDRSGHRRPASCHANTSRLPAPLPLFTSMPHIHQRFRTCHCLLSHSSCASPPAGCCVAS